MTWLDETRYDKIQIRINDNDRTALDLITNFEGCSISDVIRRLVHERAHEINRQYLYLELKKQNEKIDQLLKKIDELIKQNVLLRRS
jgi:uncharacterized protein (DUF1778 family)